jgi:hypothetical protein
MRIPSRGAGVAQALAEFHPGSLPQASSPLPPQQTCVSTGVYQSRSVLFTESDDGTVRRVLAASPLLQIGGCQAGSGGRH